VGILVFELSHLRLGQYNYIAWILNDFKTLFFLLNLGLGLNFAGFNLSCPEFLKELGKASGALLVWQDLTKLGKISGKDLNYMADMLGNFLRQNPVMAAGFVTCPIMVPEKSTLQEQMRRIEDKMAFKGLTNVLLTLRMELPPASKRVPICFQAWLVVEQSVESENVFMQSQLVLDRRGKNILTVCNKICCYQPISSSCSIRGMFLAKTNLVWIFAS